MTLPGAIESLYRSILARQRVRDEDSPEVLRQTQELCAEPLDRRGLDDLEDLPFVTIDNADSRDLDQALFIEGTSTGWTVWYALADAAHFVRPGTPLYERALARGTSYYMPEFGVPMLPAALSEGVISLNPNVTRRAVVFVVQLDEQGRAQSTSLRRAVIQSRAKLAYDDVQAWLDGKHDRFAGTPFEASLRALVEVGTLGIQAARERDAISFERYEPELRVGSDGRFEVDRRMRNDVERYNEQISLLCNTQGAQLMTEHGHSPDLQSVFRVHLPPLSQRLRELGETLRAIQRAHQLDDAWTWKRGQSLADYLAALPRDPAHDRLRMAVERQVRYANRSSDFSSTVGPHFALGVDHYARFTAPMREVVGIFTHKEALEVLGFEPPEDPVDDEVLRERVIEAANRGNATQRAIDKEIGLVVIRQIFDDDLAHEPTTRPVRTGTIIGLKASRIYVLLDDLPVDVKLWVDELATHLNLETEFDGASLRTSTGLVWRIGDEITLRASHFDHGRQHVVLLPVFD